MEIDPDLVTPQLAARVCEVRVAVDPPADFDSFWNATVAELSKVPIDLEIKWCAPPSDLPSDVRYNVRYAEWFANSLGGRRIGGPLTLPHTVAGPQWVYGHGYNSIDTGTTWRPDLALKGFVAVGLDARGYNRSRMHGDPKVPGWALAGIEASDSYILRGAVADLVRTVEAARLIEGVDPQRTVLWGGSFSGGLATLAAPWIENLAYLVLKVPTFGAYNLRRTLVKKGSGAEINEYIDALNPPDRERLIERLRYFDAVNAAPLIHRVPTTVGLGVSDVVVPGETVAALYHALGTADKELLCYPCSHSAHPLKSAWEDFESHILRRGQQICRLA